MDEEKKKLEVDESLLTEEQKAEKKYSFPLSALITIIVIAVLMIACIVVILLLDKKTIDNSSSITSSIKMIQFFKSLI